MKIPLVVLTPSSDLLTTTELLINKNKISPVFLEKNNFHAFCLIRNLPLTGAFIGNYDRSYSYQKKLENLCRQLK